ncbi:immunoglobulin-like and fibronectin type III domain-containing protein 1 [Chiloscyllium plagiosum]|uniref:immunoglobulin-like and fibronectin type III domain-containing protein 1 n=1 Tax=Chiloscyllium plagiosum TaxID=36176 RepID=UPI001CB7F90C|nr:immunoglobulin-like and fibronectin type III domain-containing protein 1 [Chiloscyllium plagiosum]XP_043572762.1 immunoglobulin-like and fibronectin type III domain-containing protein 1 [Chiloscyllium plagiosum]XP_043572763.1 immunoglobulin-like and fibronectin type III domain-containing protein 1 [Chiloscyllium plagiosum]
MEKKVNQPRNSAKPGVKTRKSSIPGVTIIEFTDDIPQGCSVPDIERRPIPLTMQEGKTANFKAAVQGNPEPTLVWSFKGESLSNGNKYKVSYDRIMNEHVLQIKQLTIDDAGSYKCTVSNEYGEARCAANLNIIEVGYKKKMKKPGEIQGKNTDPTDFRKMLKKRAPPPVKKEQKVPDEKVWEILMHADKKDYERICMEYGLTDFRGMLTKLKQMKKDREEKQAQYVKEISNLKHVETKSDGSASFGFDMELKSPELNIYLYKDGKLIPHSLDKDQKHHLKHVGKRYTFCIKDLHLNDVGLYRVNVEDTEVFATVVDISLIPVDFIHKLQDVKCKEGEDAIFECTISLPLPAEWSYKKIPLENSDKYEIKVSPDGLTQSLIIKNIHHVDKGVYIISAGAGYSSAYLSVGKNLDTASPPSLRKEMESKQSQEDFTDINLEQELNDATKGGLKGRRSSPHDKDLLTKDDLKRKSNYSSEEDSINFGRGGLQSASIDGLDDATKNGQSVYDRMGKDDSGGLNSFKKGGFNGFDGMGRDGKHGLDGIERDGKGGLDGMGRDGKGGLGGMGRDGKSGLDGMGRDGKGGLGGMGRDGKSGLDGMGRDGKGGLGGMGRDGKSGLDGMGRDGKGGLGGMGRDGKSGLDGMGRDGKGGLGGMGRDGKSGLDGMGRDGKGGLGGMGRDGKSGLDGMGRDGKGGLGGMGRDGKSGLDGMGRDGKGGLGGMGRDGKSGLDGMGRDGKGGLGGMGRDGKSGLDGMGRDGKGGLGGMGRDGKSGLDGMGRDGKGGLGGMGRDGKSGLDGMGRDGKGGLGGMGRDGKSGLDGMGRDGKGGLGGMGRDGKSGLDGMGRDGKGGLGGMGRDGKSGLDGMGRDGKGGLGGMGRDGKSGLDGMGRDGKGGLGGMGRDGKSGLDGMGRDGKGGLGGMGRDGKSGLDGMGRDGKGGLGGMGRDGKGGLEGMGRDGKDGLDGIGKDSVGRLKGMGRDEMDRMGGMGKDGEGSLDRMGRDGKGTLDGIGRDRMDKMGGMGRDSKGSLDGMGTDVEDGLYGMRRGGKGGLEEMGRDGEGGLYEIGRGGKDSSTGLGRDGKSRMHGTRKDGHDRMSDDGIDNLVNLDGSEKGSWNRSDASGWREMENNLADGFNRGKDDSAGYNNATSSGRGQSGLNDINALSLPSGLSHRSSRDGSTKGGYALSPSDQKGLLRKDQMSNQTEPMGGGFQDLSISDASQREQSGSSRRRKGKFSESDINETSLDIKNKEPVRRFKSGLLDVSARKGKAAEFCCVTANENTQGTWFKNGTKITSGNGKIVTKEGAVQKLTIPNVKEEDSGMYTFEADGGKTKASLFVEDPPEFDQDVLDRLGKKDTIIKAGHTATVKVPFSGKPPMKVSWYKDGEELFEDNRISIDNSKSFTRLSISKCNRKDSGKMTIKLKNESGTTSADVNLAVIDKPQAPQGPLKVLASLENCISLKWKPPRDDGGKPIQHYVIERQQVGRNTWTKVGEMDKSITTFSYDKVEPEKKYKFKVWAVNSEGKSEALLSDVITAGRKDVPGAPAKPNILSASSKSITVSWTPPHNTGGSRIIGYIIEKRKKGSNVWSAVTDTPVTGKKWTITDVIEGLEYEFRVIAVNSSGPGEPSCETEAAFAREPMKVPGTVRDLRVTDSTYSTISLAWTPPIYKGSDIPKGYIVEMKSSGNAAWTRCNSAAVGLNSYTVKGLKKMGMYFLRVRAVNDGGMGEPMELDNYVLAMPPPVHPKFILDESVKSFMIIKEGNSLRVQMPFEASPPPEVIWLKDGFPVSEQATITSTSGSTQLIIPASQRSHSGIYSVTLKNLLGQESFSFEIRVTAVPKPPGPVTLTENVPHSVTVSWESSSDEPLDDHLHYVVMQRDSRRLKWHTVRDNIFNNKFTVINIVPGCKYNFRVLAKNDMGYSEPSDTREPWCILRQRDPFALKLPIYKARSNMTAPEFIVRLKTHIAPSGSDINMSCAVKGFPPPKVIWFKDNINIMDDANFWSTNIYGVCSLCIFGASPKQTGEYMAIAENSVGRAITSTRLLVTE